MGVEVIHDQRDLFGVLVLERDVGQKPRPVLLFPGFGDLDQPLAHQRFGGDENIARPVSDVFVIISGGSPWFCRNRNSAFANQLLGRLIHADHRIERIIRLLVDIQHSLHLSDKIAALLWRDYPTNLLPRLEFVFFNARRTVS